MQTVIKRLLKNCKQGLFLLAVSAVVLIIIPFQTRQVDAHVAMTPGFFPNVAAGVLLIISLLLIIAEFKKSSADPDAPAEPKPEVQSRTARGFSERKLSGFGGLTVLMFGYVFCVSLFGYYIATPVFLVAFFFFFGVRQVISSLIITAVFVLSHCCPVNL